KGNDWNLLELEMDTGLGVIRLRVNAVELTKLTFDPSTDFAGRWSPTVALIGLDGKVGKLQEGHLDDIYIDNSLQRVIVGNSPSFENLTHYEVQRPISWSNTRAQFELQKG